MSDMISIIIPAYNAADYLAQTIESVLNQTYSDFELILIDDGSTDRTREIIKDYQCKDARIKYFYKENGSTFQISRSNEYISKCVRKNV